MPAGCNMESEFVCQPSYDCPATAQFLLTVVNKDANMANELQQSILTLIPEVKKKNQRLLSCIGLCTNYLQFNTPVCNFREKRLLFGTVPLNLTTTKTIHIENKGNCHAYFKVIIYCVSKGH